MGFFIPFTSFQLVTLSKWFGTPGLQSRKASTASHHGTKLMTNIIPTSHSRVEWHNPSHEWLYVLQLVTLSQWFGTPGLQSRKLWQHVNLSVTVDNSWCDCHATVQLLVHDLKTCVRNSSCIYLVHDVMLTVRLYVFAVHMPCDNFMYSTTSLSLLPFTESVWLC